MSSVRRHRRGAGHLLLSFPLARHPPHPRADDKPPGPVPAIFHPFRSHQALPAPVSPPPPDDLLVSRRHRVDLLQVVPLVLAAVMLTVGLAMFLGGTVELMDVVRPVIVVFGGTLVALLVTFPVPQLVQALQIALARGVHGGNSPEEMIRAMMKICDISRRDGLLGVAEIRSSSWEVEQVCHLIGDAADDEAIRFGLERRQSAERLYSHMTADVFLFTAVYAILIGLLGSLIHFAAPGAVAAMDAAVGGSLGGAILPFVCGVSLAILMGILLGRLRSAHARELVSTEIAYRGATIILEDNNVQRLRARLSMLVPPGLRA